MHLPGEIILLDKNWIQNLKNNAFQTYLSIKFACFTSDFKNYIGLKKYTI